MSCHSPDMLCTLCTRSPARPPDYDLSPAPVNEQMPFFVKRSREALERREEMSRWFNSMSRSRLSSKFSKASANTSQKNHVPDHETECGREHIYSRFYIDMHTMNTYIRGRRRSRWTPRTHAATMTASPCLGQGYLANRARS